jgi:serine/threonine protein kinase
MARQFTDCKGYVTFRTLYTGNNAHILDAFDSRVADGDNAGDDDEAMSPFVLKVFRSVRGASVKEVPEIQHMEALPPHLNVLAPVGFATFRRFPAALFQRYSADLFDVVLARFEPSRPCPPTMAMCRHMFVQVARAVKHCHDNGMAHLDIKLENVFVDAAGVDGDWMAMRAVLGDFEFAAPVGTSCKRSVGTNGYQAPEMLALRDRLRGFAVAPAPCDVWSLGMLLCVMATGKQVAFVCGATVKYVAEQLRANARVSNQYAESPCVLDAELESLQDLLQGMLQETPDDRMTINDVLLHAWTTGAAAEAAEDVGSSEAFASVP